MTEPTVRDEGARHRYEIYVDGVLAGFLDYRLQPDRIALTDTEVRAEFSGRGIGSTLVRYALDDAFSRELFVLPYCSFVRDLIARYDDYLPLVPEELRTEFGLTG